MAQIQVKNPNTGATFTIEESEFVSTYQPLGWTKVSDSASQSSSSQSSSYSNPSDIPTSGTGYNNLQVTQTPRYYRYDKNGNIMKDSSGNPYEYTTWLNFSDGSTLKDSGVPKYKVSYYDLNDNATHSASLEGFTQKFGITITDTSNKDNNMANYVYGSDQLNNKANNAAVNTLYQAYFGRNATQAELDNWGEKGGSDTTVKALEDFLQKERTTYNVTTPVKTLAEITGQTQEQPSQQESTQKATLYGPNNQSEIVDVGSARASELQSQGWGLTSGSYQAPAGTETTQTNISSENAYDPFEVAAELGYSREDFANDQGFEAYWKTKTPEQLKASLTARSDFDATTNKKKSETIEDKNIYKQGDDLFIKRGDTFYKIPDTDTLKDYVFNKGYIDSRLELPADATTSTAGSETAPTGEIPDALKDDPYFMQLDENNKAIVSYYYNTLASQNTTKAEAFKTALDLASQQADPYWKEKINIIEDELLRATGSADADLASQEKTLMDRKSAIQEDLTINKQYLTAEQQAELARQADSYENSLISVRDQMAATGLSSSSIRNRAEDTLAKNNADVIGSSTRAYEKNISDLSNTATRELATIAQQTADLQRTTLENKTSLARAAEASIGSSELADTNIAPLLMGDISGTLLDTKGTDILNRAKALMETNNA